MHQGFSVSSLVHMLIEAVGEGELQDSVVIGGIQYLMNDESYCCKRCSKPFSQMQVQANEFEQTFNENGYSITVTEPTPEMDSNKSIVQLQCNPAHVFHKECLQGFVYCPECFTPIEDDVPESFMAEEDDEEGMRDGDSDEEGLLRRNVNRLDTLNE